MKTMNLSEGDVEYIRLLVERDITDSAKDISFFHEMKMEPKNYIDEMISISKKLGLDFWEVVRINCSDFEAKRLHTLYEGKSLPKLSAGKK